MRTASVGLRKESDDGTKMPFLLSLSLQKVQVVSNNDKKKTKNIHFLLNKRCKYLHISGNCRIFASEKETNNN
jgi:hypothetical protein